MPTRHAVGCMTGTSIDALDAALVRIEGEGLVMRAAFVRGVSRPLGTLAPRLRDLAEQKPVAAGAVARLAREFALLHAEAVAELLAHGAEKPDLVCVHGQTVFHEPPVSWQLFSPAPLAEALGVPVVSDLRAADLARGGQGAPITPIADWVLFRHETERRAVVNLGGFCNVTLLAPTAAARTPEEGVGGMDVCACNHLLDHVARVMLRAPYDEGGAAASAGEPHAEALEDLEGVLASQSRGGRSLGTGDELSEWVSRWRAHVPASDLAATACEGVGQTIARRTQDAARVLLAGGGVRNKALVAAISGWSSAFVEPLDAHGVPTEFREAVEMGVLGALCRDGVPITLPRVTGVRGGPPVAGTWTGASSHEPGAPATG